MPHDRSHVVSLGTVSPCAHRATVDFLPVHCLRLQCNLWYKHQGLKESELASFRTKSINHHKMFKFTFTTQAQNGVSPLIVITESDCKETKCGLEGRLGACSVWSCAGQLAHCITAAASERESGAVGPVPPLLISF